MAGTLFVVATPIGNLEDASPRALRTLREADRIAAEDTRHTGRWLRDLGITTPLTSYYDAVESRKAPALVEELLAGQTIALVSDAGTPLLSDPGYRLVRAAIEAGIEVVPVPGANAAVALLSISGLPTNRFTFEGFLPAKSGKRRRRLEELRDEARTVIFYESPHHLSRTLDEIAEIFGPSCYLVIGRELTKAFEEIIRGTVASVRERFAATKPRGELTVAIGALPKIPPAKTAGRDTGA